jgi:hypothetical protein
MPIKVGFVGSELTLDVCCGPEAEKLASSTISPLISEFYGAKRWMLKRVR